MSEMRPVVRLGPMLRNSIGFIASAVSAGAAGLGGQRGGGERAGGEQQASRGNIQSVA